MIIIPTKWLFHWGYTSFSDKPIWWARLELDCLRLPPVTPSCTPSLEHVLPSLQEEQWALGEGERFCCGGTAPKRTRATNREIWDLPTWLIASYSISCTQVKIVKRIRLIGLDFDILRQVSLTLNWLSFETGQQIDRTSAASVKVFNIVQQCSKMSMLLRYARIACEFRVAEFCGALVQPVSRHVLSVYDVSGRISAPATRASLLLGTVVQPTPDPEIPRSDRLASGIQAVHRSTAWLWWWNAGELTVCYGKWPFGHRNSGFSH